MSTIETKKEFTGETVWLVIGVLFCIPFGIYYYFSNKEQVWVCPECRESVAVGAGTCKHCGTDLSSYGDGSNAVDHGGSGGDDTDEPDEAGGADEADGADGDGEDEGDEEPAPGGD